MAKRTPNSAKALIRTEAGQRISALTAEEKALQSKTVYEKLISHPWYKSANRIALFMSTPDEVDTMPIINHIKARGATAFVPQYAGGNMSMLKLENDDEKTMTVTKHGIQQHSNQHVRENALDTDGLDLIIAPGVAFTRAGDRCGHGGGYYDKFISGLRNDPATAPKVIAVAFKCQIFDEIPTNEYDQKVDEVLFAD